MFNEEAYLDRRIRSWQRLEELLGFGSGRVTTLRGTELIEAVRLYRQASGDLAYLSTHSSNADVVTYLNNLVGRAYTEIYRHPSVDPKSAIQSILARSAKTVRCYATYILVSWAILLTGAFFSFGMISSNPATRPYFVSPSEDKLHQEWMKMNFHTRSSNENLGMAAFYAQHNPQVAIMTNGLGLATFGAGAIFMDWITGLQVGSLGADMNSVGGLLFFLTSIFPHGVSEIGGLTVTSAAALLLGHALIRPGRRSRGEALRAVGPDCAVLCMLSLVMILCAAPIEAFFSFNPHIPMWAKVLLGTAAAFGWLTYFIGYAKNEAPLKSAI